MNRLTHFLGLTAIVLTGSILGLSYAWIMTIACIILVGALFRLRRLHPSPSRSVRTAARIIGICIWIFLLSFGGIEALILHTGSTQPVVDPPVHYIVILGAGLEGSVPSERLKMRLDAAYDSVGCTSIPIIVSGGQGPDETVSEAEAMKQYLIQKGIAPARIHKEDRSTSTYENLLYSKAIMDSESRTMPRRVLLVTSDYHLLRASLIASGMKLEPVGLPAPSPFPLKYNQMVREYFALIRMIVPSH